MAQGILDIFRQSNDANLGQTLIRLAKLAEARHRYQNAIEADHHREDETPAQGRNRATVAGHATTLDMVHDTAGHTEVDR